MMTPPERQLVRPRALVDPAEPHAQGGIRDELTSRTIAIVDALRSSYKPQLLKEAKSWDLDDAV